MAKETAAAKKKRLEAEAKAAAEAANTAPSGLLANAANATITGQPFMATEESMNVLLLDPRGPLVEHNKGMVIGDKIAFRATTLGMQVHAAGYQAQSGTTPAPAVGAWGTAQPQAPAATAMPQPQPAAPPSNPVPSSGGPKFDDGIAVPAARRGGRGAGVYGFETMNVGQSFFIATSGDNPNPAKRVASTVSSASDRLSPKKFIVRSVVEAGKVTPDNPTGKGARVWRTA